MTQEQEELLIKDLCARLPYGVILNCCNIVSEPLTRISYKGLVNDDYDIDEVKPYLFPLSSMTEEQKQELLELTGYEERCEESYGFDSYGVYINIVGEYDYEGGQESITLHPDYIGIDWFNKNHFDYRGLIPMGLANDATGLNIY